ncbi:MAG: hypothetical protein QOH10_689 [Actinomycetota bacterium]|jgi:hypothetical protein|nr:hypothetical protein [Actinomycetota bacterium]
MDFYGEVLLELVTALGAALFVANARALARRRTDAAVAVRRTVARSRAGSPVRGYRRGTESGDLVQAPIARTVVYLVIGLVVMIWGLASLVSR